MTKKERVLAVMKKEQVDMIPAGFWFHYKSDYTVQQMIDEHMKLFRTTDMDIIKIMQDYPEKLCHLPMWEVSAQQLYLSSKVLLHCILLIHRYIRWP